jgi:glycosyltransferase involved in cell wall biosynthesis
MVGDGPMKQSMEQLAARLVDSGGSGGTGNTILNTILFPGFVPQHELPCWLRAAHIFVFPVLYPESFVLSAVEAMLTADIPVVHFGVGGSGEYARHEKEGLVADEISAAGLARAVVRLANAPDLRRSVNKLARRSVSFMASSALSLALVQLSSSSVGLQEVDRAWCGCKRVQMQAQTATGCVSPQ